MSYFDTEYKDGVTPVTESEEEIEQPEHKGFLTFEVFSDDSFDIVVMENIDMSAAVRIRDFLNYAVIDGRDTRRKNEMDEQEQIGDIQ